jgi:hypothetical protein
MRELPVSQEIACSRYAEAHIAACYVRASGHDLFRGHKKRDG